jgi:LuxR family transcriptional regulator, maltose regulon positive regulatory protein
MMTTVSDSSFTVPLLPPKHVSRSRLLTDLGRAAGRPLTLLCAGPGAGKTVLLTEWAQNSKAQVAWITPGQADDEPRRFWNLLESALPAQILPESAQQESAQQESAQQESAQQRSALPEAAQLLLGRVTDSASPLAVIIDDAHLLTHPDVLDFLDRLIRGCHPGLRLLLAARSDPLLPLHRYRLAGQMTELRAAELAMTPGEIKKVLAAHGVSLPKRDLDLLVARTEGWAAGIRLSAMRMEGTDRPADFVSQLAMDAGSIGEYLVDEVLRRLPEEHRTLLTETSFLGEVTGPLADAVTGMTGCEDVLAGLARDNAFVIPLDPLRTRFRCHQLFGEILRYLLRRRGVRAVRRLQQRAAEWFEADGDLGGAVNWAVQAGDAPRVARLLARGGLAHALVRRQELPGPHARDLVAQPQTTDSVVAAFAAEAARATPAHAADELSRLVAWRSANEPPAPDLLLTCDLAELLLGQKASDDHLVDEVAARLLGAADHGLPPVTPGVRAAVLLAQSSTRLWCGRHEEARSLLAEALTESRLDDHPGLEVEALGLTACLDSLWSGASRADTAIQRAHAVRGARGLAAPPALELATAIRALLCGDLDAHARTLPQIGLPGSDVLAHAAQRIEPPGVVGADPALPPAAVLVMAGGLLACRRRDDARAVLNELAGRVIPPALAVRRDVLLADIETSSGRPRYALTILDPYRKTGFAPVAAPATARAHLAAGELRAARDCVRGVLSSSSPQVERFTLVDALLCAAQIAEADASDGQALEILTRALDVAQDEMILPFLRGRDAFAGLLARHPGMAARWPAPLVSAAGQPPLPIPAQRVPRDLPDPLTPRELTILRLLTTTMSTGEIAEELCLSVNTVKTHLAAIYRKLPASRRREAVQRARDLELI